ncbi:hypothetical protein FQA39_LY19145 [Lamprigera yunnana]|nr:hypothetical protein FQA39_LY19145 [Lamprigera yunnana]
MGDEVQVSTEAVYFPKIKGVEFTARQATLQEAHNAASIPSSMPVDQQTANGEYSKYLLMNFSDDDTIQKLFLARYGSGSMSNDQITSVLKNSGNFTLNKASCDYADGGDMGDDAVQKQLGFEFDAEEYVTGVFVLKDTVSQVVSLRRMTDN